MQETKRLADQYKAAAMRIGWKAVPDRVSLWRSFTSHRSGKCALRWQSSRFVCHLVLGWLYHHSWTCRAASRSWTGQGKMAGEVDSACPEGYAAPQLPSPNGCDGQTDWHQPRTWSFKFLTSTRHVRVQSDSSSHKLVPVANLADQCIAVMC